MQIRTSQISIYQDDLFPVFSQVNGKIGGDETLAGTPFTAADRPDGFDSVLMNLQKRDSFLSFHFAPP
jgi:hypothetical protein